MEMMTRRKLLSGVIVGVPAIALVGCTTNPLTGATEINPVFVDNVVAALQVGCTVVSFIPTATSVANVVAALFGASAVAAVQLISGSVAAVANEICGAVPPVAAAQSQLRRRLIGSSLQRVVYIGTTPIVHVVINGYVSK
jgi:hypothetical protein